ncbi:uncharacterized protein LOC120840457 [Ixodes scapularis]|uniref:uncharacterized protein LOC120840457 n=1 Tax=Ixodes scapularis TaxID=6945 RepID=UPI001A9CE474|nr:uncharacterized protein LOC120840457 [Ixodes scapularis]
MVLNKELLAAFEDIKNEFKAELKLFGGTFDREIRKDLRDVKASLKFINQMCKEMKTQVKVVQDENRELKKDNARLQTTCDELAIRMKDSETRILSSEQYSRNANIEIKGVPTAPNENLSMLLEQIGAQIGVPITKEDIEICHRVPIAHSTTDKNIVVQFVHTAKQNDVLEEARRYRLTGTRIGLTSNEPIYINEHLFPQLKRLLGQTTSKKREANGKFVWVRNGQTFARKAVGTLALKIMTCDDLSKIV